MRTLGLAWDCDEDQFDFNLAKLVEFSKSLELTKRNVLRLTVKLWDPLGLLAPVRLPIKVLFQTLCAMKYEWDDVPTGEHKKIWDKLIYDLEQFDVINLPRFYFYKWTDPVNSVSLHGFGDSSKLAYSCCIYLLAENRGSILVNLVTSKLRVAPLHEINIPRLELLASVILSRLMNTVQEALSTIYKFEEIHYWTDSKAVLFWLKGNKELKQFVANRKSKALSLSGSTNWHHCPGIDNPTDIGTRGMLPSELSQSKLWWMGPEWLKGPKENWPTDLEDYLTNLSEECLQEVKKCSLLETSESTSLLNRSKIVPITISDLINCEDYSSLPKLLRVTAYVMRFVNNVKARMSKRKQTLNVTSALSSQEISTAEQLWLLSIQQSLPNTQNYMQLQFQLGLFVDSAGVIRSRGRLSNEICHTLLNIQHFYLAIII